MEVKNQIDMTCNITVQTLSDDFVKLLSSDEIHCPKSKYGLIKEPSSLLNLKCNENPHNAMHKLLQNGHDYEFLSPRRKEAIMSSETSVFSKVKVDKDSMTLGLDTADDIRSQKSVHVKVHQYNLSIVNITYHNAFPLIVLRVSMWRDNAAEQLKTRITTHVDKWDPRSSLFQEYRRFNRVTATTARAPVPGAGTASSLQTAALETPRQMLRSDRRFTFSVFGGLRLQCFLGLFLLLVCATPIGAVFFQNDVHRFPHLSAEANIPIAEMNALQDLYNATNGVDWRWLKGPTDGIHWNFSDPMVNNPCVDGWQGITCSFTAPFDYRHVVSIDLHSFNLLGTLPNSLSALPELQYLYLYSNKLSGFIPETLGALTQLLELDLHVNSLIGSIPASLGSIAQLQYVDLHANLLTGRIPETLGQLSQLQYLFLYENGLTDTIPATLGYLTQLLLLDLSVNKLNGPIPATLGNLLQLQYLDLDTNQLNGTIPSSLGNLTQLQSLDLFTNALSGSIPGTFGALTGLQYLYLFTNQLTGTIPEMGNLTQLLYLYLSSNQLTGTIPASLSQLTKLSYLYLDTNRLNGTIPETLGDLSQLQRIYLASNELVGTIPESLSSLTQLKNMYLFGNFLTGTIPASLSRLTQLVYMDLNINQLNGTIPEALGHLPVLQRLYLYSNQLSGSNPASLGNLTQARYIYLYDNRLEGGIPSTLGNLLQLQYLALQTNQLTGTIPASFSALSHLQYIYLETNHLSGTIPAWLGNLHQLQYINFHSNDFTGTIPASLGNLVQLQYLYLGTNQLNGTIPRSLDTLRNLLVVDFSVNNLHGSIPNSLGNLTKLQYLLLNNNQLSNTVPASLGDLLQLQILYIYQNQLTGSLSETLGMLPLLQDLELSVNQLTGGIPATFGSTPKLLYLFLFGNHLTGPVPVMLNKNLQQLQLNQNKLSGTIPSFVHLSSLQVLNLENNQLSGNLDNAFDPTTQLGIETIVLNNNQLTGTIPAVVFELKPLTFVGTSNCFEGPLPIDAICSNLNMVSFIVDGMSSASSCRNKLFSNTISSAYALQHDIGGSIPACLFRLPNLTTLHLSGNGFTGSIPSDIVLGGILSDLSLSHNALTGSIPEQIQLKKWGNIDLSYNRLSGTLLTHFASNASIELENNRLSGAIPSSFRSLVNVSVLGSNTFSCSYDESSLPQNDPNKERYHCGSNSFDVLFYLWLGAAVGAALGLGFCVWKYYAFLSRPRGDTVLCQTNLYDTLSSLCQMSLQCAVYCLVVLLPLYCICDVFYGTQTYTYAYQVSAVYMAGVVPFALFWCFWLVLILAVAAGLLVVLPTSRLKSDSTMQYGVQEGHALPWSSKTMFVFISYLFINFVVVVGVNAAYVYVAVYQSSSLLFLVQTLLSIFKVAWNKTILPKVLAVLTQQQVHSRVHILPQVIVNMVNHIVIPCLVVAVVSPNCFYNALVAAPEVKSRLFYNQCFSTALKNGQCQQYGYIYLETSYAPPFTYNYQCSSSLVTYYAPAFVSMCIVSTFVTPLVQYLYQWLHRRAIPGTYWYKMLDYSIPRIMKPIDAAPTVRTTSVEKGYLNTTGLLTTLISVFGIQLTFGAVFPPLCAALVVTIAATVLIFRANVSWFLASAAPQQYEEMVERIRIECTNADFMHVLSNSVWLLVTVSCWFYTLFLFDTLGDAVGFEGAYWVLIVMPLMPLMLYLVYVVLGKFSARFTSEPTSVESHVVTNNPMQDFEMQSIIENRSIVHNSLLDDSHRVCDDK